MNKQNKMLLLTEITPILTEEGSQRVNGIKKETKDKEPDWDSLGLPNPNKENEDGFVELDDKDFEVQFKDLIIDSDYIAYVSDAGEDYGSMVVLKSGEELMVKESVKEIYHRF